MKLSDTNLFILLFILNFITSCLFLYYSHELYTEIIKSGKRKSQLVKKKEEKVNNVILIQFGVNLLFIILTQYRTKIKNIPLSIVWGITPLFYYLLAHLWKKVKSSSESEKIFLWMVSFFILNVFAFFGMIGHRQNFGLVYLSS